MQCPATPIHILETILPTILLSREISEEYCVQTSNSQPASVSCNAGRTGIEPSPVDAFHSLIIGSVQPSLIFIGKVELNLHFANIVIDLESLEY